MFPSPTPQQSWVALSHFWNTSTLYLFVFDMWLRSPVPVSVPVTFLGDLPGRKSGLRIAGGRKMPMWSRDYSSKWHFLQARNLLKLMIIMLMAMVARLKSKSDIFCATPAHWAVLTCSLGIRRNISDLKTQIRLSNISKRNKLFVGTKLIKNGTISMKVGTIGVRLNPGKTSMKNGTI